jgi:hypothetical protein
LLKQVHELVPVESDVIFLGDGEFDGILVSPRGLYVRSADLTRERSPSGQMRYPRNWACLFHVRGQMRAFEVVLCKE